MSKAKTKAAKVKALLPKQIAGQLDVWRTHGMRQMTALRLSKGMTQEELARKLDVTPSMVCKWEQGRNVPSPRNFLRLANQLEVAPEFLVGIVVPGTKLPPITPAH
jgi:DNA-binding transcriptional regulator YiaG